MNADDKLWLFARREIANSFDNLIIDTEDGAELFGRYSVRRSDDGYDVYRRGNLIVNLASLRSAISWCIADNKQRWNIVLQIEQLDLRSRTLSNSLATRKKGPRNEISRVKIEHREAEKYRIDQQLEKYVELAKYLQFKGLTYDTQRYHRNRAKKASS